MIVSSAHLFTKIHACIGLFARLWRVPMPSAYAMCYDGAMMIADKLDGFHAPYRFSPNLQTLLQKPLTIRTLIGLGGYALPSNFFGQEELAYWQKTYPNQPPKNTLCVVGLLLLWVAYHDVPPLAIGRAVLPTYPYTSKRSFLEQFDTLSYEKKAWLFVGVFLGVLGLVIWHTRPETLPQDDKPKAQKPIYDVAIIRIDDEKTAKP